MSSLLAPDLRRMLAEIARRLEALERRIDPRAITPSSSRHTHDGTGADSTITLPTGNTDTVASGSGSVAVGWEAVASGGEAISIGSGDATDDLAICIGDGLASAQFAVAVGSQAEATDTHAAAFGSGANATGDRSAALGPNSEAAGLHSTAVGFGAYAANDDEVALGQPGVARIKQSVPASAIADGDLDLGQLSFYLDEGSDLLTVKVKYSDNTTVKTGTVALT